LTFHLCPERRHAGHSFRPSMNCLLTQMLSCRFLLAMFVVRRESRLAIRLILLRAIQRIP
jgi:hypothetical protein